MSFSAPLFLLLLLLCRLLPPGQAAQDPPGGRGRPRCGSAWGRGPAGAGPGRAAPPRPPRSVATVFVLDFSDSVPDDVRAGAREWVRQALGRAGPDDLSGIVTFGADARVELPLGRARDHPRWGAPPLGHGTDVGGALRLAGSLLPPPDSGPLRRIVLLSDGNETASDARRSLMQPGLRDVEIAVLVLPPSANRTPR